MHNAIKCITEKYFDFSSRAPKKEFWFFILFYFVGLIILIVIDVAAETYDEESGLGVFSGIFYLLTIIPGLAVSVRRLHDTNRVGWWVLISIIPIVGPIWLIVLYCYEGDEGENRFGENPLTSIRNGAPKNISVLSATTDNSINERSKDISMSKIPESNNSTAELEQELKKIDDMFEKSLITEDEKKQMRNKVLGLG